MGNTVQKIFQGRGDKKRQDFWIKNGLPFLLLFLTYLGLLFEFPSKRKVLWFLCSIATIAPYAFHHIVKKERRYSVEFLISLALFIAGVVQTSALPWLRLAYFPFMIILPAFYGYRTIISLLLLIPFLELNTFLKGEMLVEEIIFIVSLAVTVGLSLLLGRGRKKENLRGVDAIGNTASEDQIQSFNDEKIISHYLESMFKPDDEIKELLSVIKNMVFADSLHLFVSSGGSLRLRCSTDEEGVITSDGGLIYLCFKERKAFLSLDISDKKLDTGYLRKGKISSIIAVPVMDDTIPLGVMSADSARFHAFSSADTEMLQKFSNQIMRILQRERVYPQIHRSYSSLKMLNEESSKLLSSLNIDVIVTNLVEGASRIAPSEIIFFMAQGKEFEIVYRTGHKTQEKQIIDISGTLLDMSVKNKQHVYISDVRNYRSPIMPFKTEHIDSVFVLPMIYEKNLLGILALLLEKTNALSPHQIDLLRVLGNQASTSIANAKFHAEIERLAVTDGLTGLYNHRHFQERLALEFHRLERFSEPISLLLIDIDHFKKINDTYGHPVGDSVLKRVADIIKSTIRNIDIPARYGGEEFAVILLGTDSTGAMKMGERLRKAVMNEKFSSEKNTFHVTISTGISTYSTDITKKEDLIQNADKALYHAKRTGRNKSVLWSESN